MTESAGKEAFSRAVEPGAGRRRTWMHVGLLVLVCAALFLYKAASLPLTDPEEARCGLIVRTMSQTGDWLVPHLGKELYFDKPAPYFWLAALAQRLTGSMELGGRSVSVLSAILTVLVTYAFTRRIFGAMAGLAAGLVLATSVEFLFVARWFRMEMPFEAAMWGAIWWFWRSEDPSRGSRHKAEGRRSKVEGREGNHPQ